MKLTRSNSLDKLYLKEKYLELITEGYAESVALDKIDFPRGLYLQLMFEDHDFNAKVEQARKARADFWVSKIISSVDEKLDKEDVPAERLKFDKLQYLAKADNPERYGNNSKKLDVNIDLSQFKLLPPDQALKALAADPFAIDADFTEIKEDELL